jgi:hypothetical protein
MVAVVKQQFCIIDSCENPLSPRSKLTICETCRSGMGTWLKRRPAEVIERRRKLHMYDSRMDQLVDYKADKKARGYK